VEELNWNLSVYATTSYVYNARDQLTQSNQAGQIRSFDYDGHGRLWHKTTPEQGTTTFSYNVDDTINVLTEKTGRRQDLPIAEPLARNLSKLAGDNPEAPLCPALCGKKASWLSAQFYAVMVQAGLAKDRDHQTRGKGRDAKRDTSKISFHSLRYNTTSALKSAGVGDSVAMDIVGHETAAVSRNYTKIDDAAKRAAIAKLPDITK